MAGLNELLAAENRPAALYASMRNEVRDAAESLSRAAGLYLEVIQK